jgi:hypothetical protein
MYKALREATITVARHAFDETRRLLDDRRLELARMRRELDASAAADLDATSTAVGRRRDGTDARVVEEARRELEAVRLALVADEREPRTWLLKEGWRRGGPLIRFHEVPSSTHIEG